MSETLRFLPWLRRGLTQSLTTVDPLVGPLLPASVTAWVEVNGARAQRTVRLQGPDAVTGLRATQILREEPKANTADFEPNYFPCIELVSPDLPWMFTPAKADAQGRLRPWMVLVVVRVQEGVSLASRGGALLPVLTITAPAVPSAELPDLADAWGWVHVQSAVEVADVSAAVSGTTGEVIVRLVAPRHLIPNTSWIACLVPAFDSGVARGLGQAWTGTTHAPAWDLSSAPGTITLPVYHSWRFSTGEAGDFEALCRRLQPDGDGAELGLHALDVRDPGLVSASADTVLVDYEGAMKTVEAQSRAWDATHKTTFQAEIIDLLDAGATRTEVTPPLPGEAYDPATQDPVVTPPMYGAWPAGVDSVPASGWVRTVNDHPFRRAAAGLGARVVRSRQEELVAAAWDQAGDLPATTTALNRGRLAVEIGRSWTRRAVALESADLVQLTGRVQGLLATPSGTVRQRLTLSAVPNGLVSAAYARRVRPGTPISRDWKKRTGTASRVAAEHVRINLDASAEPDSVALGYAHVGLPDGAVVSDYTLTLENPELNTGDPHGTLVATQLERDFALDRPAPVVLAPRFAAARLSNPVVDLAVPEAGMEHGVPTAATAATEDVSDIGDAVRESLDPNLAVRASVLARVPTLEAHLPADALPTRIIVGPVFEDPLFWDLAALGAEWVMPGIDGLGANRVRLVEANAVFVGAFLIGANHELARELLWRGYPVDVRATFFTHFWAYTDPARRDINELHTWTAADNIRENLAATTDAAGNPLPDMETLSIFIIRGDVVKRYPTAHYFLQAATVDADGNASPVEGTVKEPSFSGTLGDDTVFYGFDLAPETVRGDRANGVPGWFLAIEEQAGAPRFGLDEAGVGDFSDAPKKWNGLTWGHTAASQEELDALVYLTTDNTRLAGLTLHGTTWGQNSAHQARATWQRPFRMLIHADLLV